MRAVPRPPSPPTDLVRRGEARLLARLPGLAAPTDDADGDPTDGGAAEPPREPGAAGEHGRYVFGEVFAAGGLGVVRRGEDRRLGRTIAIKELRRDGPQAHQRFALEAAITARLQHPGIVPLYDLGWRGSGEPFYCMKLVDGESLEQKIARARDLPARLRLLEHVVAVADAIAYAHEQRIVHRDLKPANVLVGPFGETVVIDWGLAKDLSGTIVAEPTAAAEPGASQSGPSDMTEAGTVMGTLRYMSPEQAAGEPVDARSDVYALGAILYHVLAGAPPFADVGGRELARRVLAGALDDLRRDPAIPRGLAAIAHRALAREPADRYGSAGEFAEDIRRFLAGRLVSAHAYSLGEIAGLWLRRHRVAVAVASASLASLAVVGVVAAGRIAGERALVAEAERTAASEAERAERAAFERAALAEADRAGEVLRLARTAGREREALALGVEVLGRHAADLDAAPRVAVDGLAHALQAMLPAFELSAPEHAVYAASFSPDGALVATYPWMAGPDDRILIRSTDRLDLVAALPAGESPLGHMVFSPDHRRLAVGGEERCVVWDLASGAKQFEVAGCAQPFFSVDGALLLGKSVGEGFTWGSRNYAGLAAWDAADGAPRWTVPFDGLDFGAVAHPDGRRIVVKRDHRAQEQIEVYAAETGARLAILRDARAAERYAADGPVWPSRAFALAPDGRHVAVVEAVEDGRLLVWDLDAQTMRDLGPVQHPRSRSLGFSRDGRRVIVAGGGLDLFDVAGGGRSLSLPGPWFAVPLQTAVLGFDGESLWHVSGELTAQDMAPGSVRQLVASADGRRFVTVTQTGATLWSARDFLALDAWAPPPGERVVGLHGDEVTTRDGAGVLRIHDRRGARAPVALASRDPRQAHNYGEARSGGGGVWRRIDGAATDDGTQHVVNRLSLHDRSSGAELFFHDDTRRGFHVTAAAARDAAVIAAATADGGIDVIDAARDRTVCAIPGDGAALEVVAITDRGEHVAAVRKSGELELWDARACQRTAALRPFSALEVDEQLRYLRTFEFAADGALALRYRGRTVVIDPRTGAERLRVDDPCLVSQPWGHSHLAPDGRHLLTTCETGARGWLWDVEGRELVAAVDLGGLVGRPEFSRDGESMAFRTGDGRLTIVGVADGRPRFELRGRAKIERFALRGERVDVLGDDGSVYTYPLTRAGLLSAACRALSGTADAGVALATCADLAARTG